MSWVFLQQICFTFSPGSRQIAPKCGENCLTTSVRKKKAQNPVTSLAVMVVFGPERNSFFFWGEGGGFSLLFQQILERFAWEDLSSVLGCFRNSSNFAPQGYTTAVIADFSNSVLVETNWESPKNTIFEGISESSKIALTKA